MNRGGVDPARIVPHFLTLNLDDYPYHEGFDSYYLYFGRLSGEKGVKTLIRAVAQVSRPDIPCLIVGDGPSRPELEAEARALGLKNVRFLGYQSGQALKGIIAKAMFVVVPSEWYENSPLVIYEPFALGTPVVGARIGGIPEFITEGETGWLFPSKNVEALADRIGWMLSHPQDVMRMGRSARAFAEQEFDPASHAQWLLSLYRQLIGQGGIQRHE